jgi:hypothetical protein
MLDRLSIPPRLVMQALDDLHTLARNIGPLTESARVLPRTEDELSANIALLRDDIQALNAQLVELKGMLRKLPGI